jgi:transcriptional regulator with XRE-family HTH domain
LNLETTQPEFGASLREMRQRRRLPIRSAADLAGIGKGLLSKIERGSDVQLSTVNKIVSAYGLRLSLKETKSK